MKLRPPSVPLITIDPYFSVWSPYDKLYEGATEHWTASANSIIGKVFVDGAEYRFMGEGEGAVIEQLSCNVSALATEYKFGNEKIVLSVRFFTPLLPDDLYRLSRPVSYMDISYKSADELEHNVSVELLVSDEICMNKRAEREIDAEIITHSGLISAKIGCKEQNILNRSGDDLRIDWGYFYLSLAQKGTVSFEQGESSVFAKAVIDLSESSNEIILFSYDDIYSLNYFGENVTALWKTKGNSVLDVISEAFSESAEIYSKCIDFGKELISNATAVGGEMYSELVSLAYRQVIAAHKLAVDNDGNNLFISKECFSNGCAATVDVTYPSSPLFLLYNTELLKGMLRPIFRFANSDEWKFDFAPHDVGQYPLVTGQVYGKNHEAEGRYADYQMPVEECGNMLIMMANICFIDNNTDFFDNYRDTLDLWVRYLIEYGMDPAHQLCTDDFAGHLAHNCNLSLKAIMGIEGYGLVLKMKNDESAAYYLDKAKEMAENWVAKAANKDGSFRLTFDREGTFSMKYNMVWDKFWNTGLFAPSVYYSEFSSNLKRFNAYGMPLDNRKTYTKSDWLLWTACLAPEKSEFEKFIEPMWNCYNVSPSRVPMTDWYDTVTSSMVGFRHRSVQGGLFIALLNFDI